MGSLGQGYPKERVIKIQLQPNHRSITVLKRSMPLSTEDYILPKSPYEKKIVLPYVIHLAPLEPWVVTSVIRRAAYLWHQRQHLQSQPKEEQAGFLQHL